MRKKRVSINKELVMDLFRQGYSAPKIAAMVGNSVVAINNFLSGLERKNYFKETSSKFIVYLFYTIDNCCIYIGQTINLLGRLYGHRASQWYLEVYRIKCYSFNCHADMAFYEANEIAKLKPKYNTRAVNSKTSEYHVGYIDEYIYNLNGVLITS